MKIRQSFLLWVVLCWATGSQAGTIPADGDQWTEYPTASGAEADGWFIECGLSQNVVVSTDGVCGDSSVGCRAARAYWCDEFGLEKSVPLQDATGFSFWHKAAWDDWYFRVLVYLLPTVQEADLGVTAKRVVFHFFSSTTWVQNSFDLAAGEWEWEVGGSWQTGGYTQTMTELVSVRWSFCRYFGVAIGDEMLIDGLFFETPVSAVPDRPSVINQLIAAPNPFNPTTEISFTLAEAKDLQVAVYSLAGELVRVLEKGVFEEGAHHLIWNGRDLRGQLLPSGVYFVRLKGPGVDRAEKVVLAK